MKQIDGNKRRRRNPSTKQGQWYAHYRQARWARRFMGTELNNVLSTFRSK